MIMFVCSLCLLGGFLYGGFKMLIFIMFGIRCWTKIRLLLRLEMAQMMRRSSSLPTLVLRWALPALKWPRKRAISF